MAKIWEDTEGKIRDLPINGRLNRVLLQAAASAGVDVVRVTSGGQAKLGSGGKRTGSTRHDEGNAADLQLIKDGRTLKFADQTADPVVLAFVTAAAANGAIGIGAGFAYMGPTTLHVGFGKDSSDSENLTWGAEGLPSNAPGWLKQAAQAGWKKPAPKGSVEVDAQPVALFSAATVVARSGVRLRGGPGTEFGFSTALLFGTQVQVVGFAGVNGSWAKIDIEGDGIVDGFVLRTLLAPVSASSGGLGGEEVDEP